jgi:predicted transcriptional regulator
LEEVTKNPRADITDKKYRKQIDWRRNKVQELLIRGYSQYEISNTLHISQPTISRDIDFIRKENSSAEKRKNLPYRYYFEQQNALDGVAELMKNLLSFFSKAFCYYFKLIIMRIFMAFRVHSSDDMKISYHCNQCDKEFIDKEMAMEHKASTGHEIIQRTLEK